MVLIRGKAEGKMPFTTEGEDIHSIDLDHEIDAAVAQGAFRQAVRLQYLRSLKILSERDKIRWRSSKTNIDYLSELSGSPLQEGFAKITRVFDYAWYGEMDIPQEQYERASSWFVDFNKTVVS
jgi:hypothetical protein